MEKVQVSINELIPLIKEKLESNGTVTLTITGNSMNPFFFDKKTIVTLKKPNIKLKRKDIVLYQCPNGVWALHRILRVKENYYVICGDALRILEYIPKNKVVAMVVSYRNNNKEIKVDNFLYNLKVNIWLLLRPFRKYLIYIIRRIRRKN